MVFRHEKESAEVDFRVIESQRIEVKLPADFGGVNCEMAVVAAAINTLYGLEPEKQITGQQIIDMLEKAGKKHDDFTAARTLPSLLKLIKSGLGLEIKCRWLPTHADFGGHLFETIKREIRAGRLVELGIECPIYWFKEIRGVACYQDDGSSHDILINGYSELEVFGKKECIFEVCDPFTQNSKNSKMISVRLSDLQEALVDGLFGRLLGTLAPIVDIHTFYRD